VANDWPVQTLKASVVSRSPLRPATHGSPDATTNTVSTQNSPAIVEPKQMTDPGVNLCIEVARR
jgi:hypothetical protein